MIPPIYEWLKTSAVQAIAGTPPRAYRHGDAPQDITRPYITWLIVSGTPQNQLSGTPLVDAVTVQVDCWHQTDAGVEALAVAVRNAIEPHADMTGIIINTREAETLLYRISLQFDVWHTR
jgi:hypothetical protein